MRRLNQQIDSGRIGCAYYDPVKCTVYTFEDTPENQHFDLTKNGRCPADRSSIVSSLA